MSASSVLRILDASLNRAGEGLRVVEDYVRFVLDDAHLTDALKRLRHDLAAIAAAPPAAQRHACRDTLADVGTAITTPSETARADAWAVCAASFERTKQSLRSLEEYFKTLDPAAGAAVEALRYRLYTLEAAVGRTADAVGRLADVRLYVLVDGGPDAATFRRLIAELTDAGVGAIQLRDKRLSDRELIERARAAMEVVRQLRRPLLFINDRADVAAAVGADGVHLGQDDMTVKDARAVVGPRALVGVSTHSLDQARAAVLAGANYIGVGPTFPTPTKQFDAFPGVELLRQVSSEIRLPGFAIVGITLENLDDVLAAGATRVAVSSAIAGAASPADAVRRFEAKMASKRLTPVEPPA